MENQRSDKQTNKLTDDSKKQELIKWLNKIEQLKI